MANVALIFLGLHAIAVSIALVRQEMRMRVLAEVLHRAASQTSELTDSVRTFMSAQDELVARIVLLAGRSGRGSA